MQYTLSVTMMTAVIFVMLLLLVTSLQEVTRLQPSYVSHDAVKLLSGGVDAVLATVSQPRCSIMFLTDGASTLSTVAESNIINLHQNLLPSSSSVSVWEVAADGQGANMTLTRLPHVVDQARRVGHSHVTTDSTKALSHF
nr:uncharacterized protein LOC123755113 [Procambarus clarkii]